MKKTIPVFKDPEIGCRAGVTGHEGNRTNWYASLQKLLCSDDGTNGISS